MRQDYTSDDDNLMNRYVEGLDHLNTKYSTGQDQFTPKLKTRGNPNQRLSYASYFEEDNDTHLPEIGDQVKYDKTGEDVNVVYVDKKSMTVTIELPSEEHVFDVPVSDIT